MITAHEKYLSFTGHPRDAHALIVHLREVHDYSGFDMPKVLNDFVFNLEVQLQNIGYLDESFNLKKEHEMITKKVNQAMVKHWVGSDHDSKEALLGLLVELANGDYTPKEFREDVLGLWCEDDEEELNHA
jgi:hypothetical protein